MFDGVPAAVVHHDAHPVFFLWETADDLGVILGSVVVGGDDFRQHGKFRFRLRAARLRIAVAGRAVASTLRRRPPVAFLLRRTVRIESLQRNTLAGQQFGVMHVLVVRQPVDPAQTLNIKLFLNIFI